MVWIRLVSLRKKPSLSGVQNGNQRYFRQIQALTQQIDAHNHVDGPYAQVFDDFHALKGVNLVVHVFGFDAVLFEIIGQILGHLDGQGRDQCTLTAVDAQTNFTKQVFDLPLDWAHHNNGIQQACGADDLLSHATGMFPLIIAWRGGNENFLVDFLLKFLEFQRAVVKRRRQAEPVFHQRFFAAVVTAEHTADLRQHDVAFIHHQQEIVREIIQQRGGRGTWFASGQYGRVILNALAHTDFLQHFHVVVGTLLDALRLEQLALFGKFFDLLFHLDRNLGKALFHLFRPDNIMAGREDGDMPHNIFVLTGQRVKLDDTVDLITEKLYPDGIFIVVGKVDIYGVALDAELVADKVHVVALVLQLDQAAAKHVALHLHTGAQADDHAAVINRIAQRVDAGNAGNDDDIAAL